MKGLKNKIVRPRKNIKKQSYIPKPLLCIVIEPNCNVFVLQLAQDRVNELITNNCLVSQLSEAGDFLMSTTQCLKTEAEVFSQLLNETQEHALAGMTELWNVMNEYGHLACDGMELFSQYIWNTLPEFYEPALLDVNLFNIDDEDFFFVAEEPMPRRRRSMLYIGSR